MGSTNTERVATSISSGDICTQVWHMRREHTCEKSLQAKRKKGTLKGASTCNMQFGRHDILDKKMKVNSAPLLTAWKVILIIFT